MVAFAPVAEPSALRLAVWPEQSRRVPASPGVRSPRYIDAPVCRDEDKNSDGDCIDPKTDPDPAENEGDEHLYYCQDANFNTTALVDGYDGAVVERYMYDPYGKVSVRHGVRDSGGTDTSESEWDERTSNTFENEILYCGYRYDTETGLYHVRNRMYHPTLGRWISRDPGGAVEAKEGRLGQIRESLPDTIQTQYADGMNLYQYCRSRPTVGLDPSGKIVLLIHGWTARYPFLPPGFAHHFGRDEMRLIRSQIASGGVKDTFKLKGPEEDVWQYIKAAAERNKKDGFHCEPIIIIGYSDGATQIRMLSKQLMSEYPDETIDYVGIIDMVCKYLGSVETDDETKLRANVLDGDNYYQREDIPSLKGMRIYAPPTVRNHRLKELSTGEEATHLNIITDPSIHGTIANNAVRAWQKAKAGTAE